jgi:hypothetical protein
MNDGGGVPETCLGWRSLANVMFESLGFVSGVLLLLVDGRWINNPLHSRLHHPLHRHRPLLRLLRLRDVQIAR